MPLIAYWQAQPDDSLTVPELKARINAFLAERRNKNTVFDKPVDDVLKLDEMPTD